MAEGDFKAIASVRGNPIHGLLSPFPFVFFVATLVTDIAYWKTSDVMWEMFSDWLLLAGLVTAAFAMLAGLIDFLGNPRIRALGIVWVHFAANVLAMILAIINAFVHSRDGYTAIVPTGLTLSLLVVFLLSFAGWIGKTMIYRHRVGVTAR
ncbi:DUF2231 domain-containing protein [Caballeronia novacaledonica]|uniref:DUF2231 domain-containing protein n=1 Tax=Caballeronia novacaledonica TaxID=1544861 RepID=A0AA37MJ62_9BURK|nr:DUF2231 domain-containing protein [Caballeronia novacaledonica]GJH28993.1 DUF2231 domain-containing protein [Caballeronia novacaledonica]